MIDRLSMFMVLAREEHFGRAAEVLVADGAAHLIADREKLSDILARERLL